MWQQLIGLRLDGVEVTQGIQCYHAHLHLTYAADRGPDNSVRGKGIVGAHRFYLWRPGSLVPSRCRLEGGNRA